jgi:hypothetical protein
VGFATAAHLREAGCATESFISNGYTYNCVTGVRTMEGLLEETHAYETKEACAAAKCDGRSECDHIVFHTSPARCFVKSDDKSALHYNATYGTLCVRTGAAAPTSPPTAPPPPQGYYAAGYMMPCPETDKIDDIEVCKNAGQAVSYPYQGSVSSQIKPAGCFWELPDDETKEVVMFNDHAEGGSTFGVGGMCFSGAARFGKFMVWDAAQQAQQADS